MSLKKKRKAVVIGTGVSGLTTAFQLCKRGWNVSCFERDFLGAGCTYASVGLVYPTVDPRAPSSLRSALLNAYRNYDHFLAEIKQAIGEDVTYIKTNLLEASIGEEKFGHQFGDIVHQYEQLGIYPEPLNKKQVMDIEPMIRCPSSGLLHKSIIWIDPPSLLNCLKRAVHSVGGRIHAFRGVEAIDINDGSCKGVVVEAEHVAADAVIVCAGAWSRTLLGRKNKTVMRGQCFVARGVQPKIPTYVGNLDLVPLAGGCTLVGATQELGEPDRISTVGGIHSLINEIKVSTKWSLDMELVELRVGIRSCEPDGLPLVGSVPDIKNLFVLAGLWRNGIGLGPNLGFDLANQIADNRTASSYPEFSLANRW